jgi:TRAP-type mannitol/chloroaromatic compound transport system substrate-binding protein
MYEPLAKELEEASNGRLQVKIHYYGEVVSALEIADAVSAGVIELGEYSGYYLADKMPVGNVEGGLPFSYQNVQDFETVLYDMGLLPLVTESYAKLGLRYLAPIHWGSYTLFSTQEVTTLSDLQKMKIRTSGTFQKFLDNAGIATMYLSGGDIYMALATGTIDASMYAGATIYDELKFYEVAPYWIKPDLLGDSADCLIMNLDLYNSLPADLQSILDVTCTNWSHNMGLLVSMKDLQALQNDVENHGVQVIQLDDATVAALHAAAVQLWDDLAASDATTAKAVEIVKQYLKLTGQLQ